MKKIRYYLAVIALLATLSGPALQVFGASFAAAHTTTTGSVSIRPNIPCPSGGTSDC